MIPYRDTGIRKIAESDMTWIVDEILARLVIFRLLYGKGMDIQSNYHAKKTQYRVIGILFFMQRHQRRSVGVLWGT
jgi:hypothetical protein